MNNIEAKRADTAETARTAGFIAGVAAKVGLYIGTVVITCKAVVAATEIAQHRLAIPGGEILTIPLSVALFLVGWAARVDVEHAWKQYKQQKRRRAHGRKK